MNAVNRLKEPKYFIPDPWTDTNPDDSFWSCGFHKLLSQAVNDNASSRIDKSNILFLGIALIRYVRLKRYPRFASLLLKSFRKRWCRALFLDALLNELHTALFNTKQPSFSTLFLNAGAHIQHHYMLRSQFLSASKGEHALGDEVAKADPLVDLFQVYDGIIGDILSIRNVEVIFATGLSQVPYDREKYYWRLKNHSQFLKALDLKFIRVLPRMTRDFLIEFEDLEDLIKCKDALKVLKGPDQQEPLFGELQANGLELFATLTYGQKITRDMTITSSNGEIRISDYLVFVAIKNGMHSEVGHVFCTDSLKSKLPKQDSHVKMLKRQFLLTLTT